MKKILLTFLSVLLLVGCSSGPSAHEVVQGELIETDSLNIEFKYAEIDSRISTTNPSGYFRHIEAESQGHTILDVVLDVQNMGTKEIDLDDLAGTMKIGDVEAKVKFTAETENYSYFDEYYTIKPQEIVRLHVYSEIVDSTVIADEDAVVLSLNKLEEKIGNYSFTMPSLKETFKSAAVGDVVSLTNTFDLTIENVSIKEEIAPTNKGEYWYFSYKNESPQTSTWYVISWTMVNNSQREIDINDHLSVSATADGKYEYWSEGAYVEEADGSSISMFYEEVKPLESRKMYSVVEIPTSMDGKPIMFTFAINGVKYQIPFNN